MANRRTTWKPRLLTAAWLVWLATICFAQQPLQYKYSTEDGLPSPEVEAVRFTKKGEAWAMYASGDFVSRFDGVNWTHYRLDSLGLPPKLMFIAEDSYGQWFQPTLQLSSILVRFTPDGQWKSYKLDDHGNCFYDTEAACVKLLADHTYTYAYMPEKDAFVRSEKPLIPNAGPQTPGHYYSVGYDEMQSVYLLEWINSTPSGLYYFGNDFKQKITYQAGAYHVDINNDIAIEEKNGRLFIREKGRNYPISVRLPDGQEGVFVKGVQLIKWDNGPSQLYQNGYLVKHPKSEAVYLCSLENDGRVELQLSNVNADGYNLFSQDPQGNWWYGSSTGLARTDRSQLVFDERNPEMVSGLHAIGQDAAGNIWFGGYNGLGGFSVFDGQRLRRRAFSDKAIPVLPDSYLSLSGRLFFFAEGEFGLCSIKDGVLSKTVLSNMPRQQTGFYLTQISGGKMGLGLNLLGLGIAEEMDGSISSLKIVGREKGLLLENVLTITEDRSGRLWCGRTSQGIAVYDPARDTAVTWLRSNENPKSVGALASCLGEDGTLWLGTNNGIYQLPNAHLFDYLNKNLFDALVPLPLPGDATQRIHAIMDTERFLIAGSTLGVYFLDKQYRGKRPRIFSLLFDKAIKGQGVEQNALLLDSKGYLWVGTQGGATRLDLAALQFDTSATHLQLQHFTAGDVEISLENGQIGQLPAKKRNFRFAFTPSGNVFLKDNLFFDIAVVNGRGDTLFWRSQTTERSGEMPYLPQGEYTLHVTAYKHNIVSGEEAWQFTVPRLPSENPWYWAGLALLVLGIPFSFFYLKKRHQAELEKSRRERDALQIRALSNFFNPHFINNSLHWVQSRYRKDADTATIVGRLSENVDHLFENTQSGKAYHPLAKELNIVQNYLKIQQVRFGEELHVSLDLPQGEAEMERLAVPSMLLQIHAENAVEKGIRNRKGAGHFSLSVKMENDGCHITIEDDGRGRPSTRTAEAQFGGQLAELGFGGTRKGSTAVMDDLIALFNRYNKQPLTVRYEDFVFPEGTSGENDGKRHGTRVHFFIPKNFNYELS